MDILSSLVWSRIHSLIFQKYIRNLKEGLLKRKRERDRKKLVNRRQRDYKSNSELSGEGGKRELVYFCS